MVPPVAEATRETLDICEKAAPFRPPPANHAVVNLKGRGCKANNCPNAGHFPHIGRRGSLEKPKLARRVQLEGTAAQCAEAEILSFDLKVLRRCVRGKSR